MRILIRVLIASTLMAATAVGTGQPAFALDDGAISGTVTDVNGPVEGIAVSACSNANAVCYNDTSAADGKYNLAGALPGSDYIVEFWSVDNNHADEFYDSVQQSNDATLVVVAPGVTTPGIDAELEIAGSISGTVTDSNGPLYLPDVQICLAPDGLHNADCFQMPGFGDYEIDGLAPGEYTVHFNDLTDQHVDEYYDGTISSANATLVVVTSAVTTTGIDAELDAGGSIEGTVSNSDGPLGGVYVDASSGTGTFGSTVSSANGSYAINGLAPASDYVVSFDDYPGAHIREYFDDASSFDNATSVEVVAGSATLGIDAELEKGGSISGTVTDMSGPIENATACVYSASTGFSQCGYSDAVGAYTIARLPAASDYEVRFDSPGADHVGEYWDDAQSFNDLVPVSVDPGLTTSGIDAELELSRMFHLLPQACRVLSTGPIAGGDSIDFEVAGVLPSSQNPVPASCAIPASADGVFANVIVDNSNAEGNLRLTAQGATPNGGIVNFSANGLNNSNAQSVPLSASQMLNVSVNGGPAGVGQVLADGIDVEILGWYGPQNGGGAQFQPVTPCAVFDSRANQGGSGLISSSATFTVDVIEEFPVSQGGGNTNCGVYEGTSAVLVNLVLVGTTGETTATSDATGATLVSNISHSPAPMNNSSAVVVPVDIDGNISINVDLAPGAGTHLRAVILGSYETYGTMFVPLAPCVVFDSRSQQGAAGGFAGVRLGGQETYYDVAGFFSGAQGGGQNTCGVPEDAAAVEINLVAVNAVREGNLQAFATWTSPTGGVLNFAPLTDPMNNSNAIAVPVTFGGGLVVVVNGGPSGVGQPVADIRGVVSGYYVYN